MHKYHTYRIRVSNLNTVVVEKRGADNNLLGNPSGKFVPENLASIRKFHEAACKNELNETDVEDLGVLLFETLLDHDLRNDFFNFYEKAKQDKSLLRVELEIDEQELLDVAVLPWEFLFIPPSKDHGKSRFATDPNIIFSRWRAQRVMPEPIQLKPVEQLRIALAVAAPEGLGTVQYQKIYDSLKELALNERIEVLEIVIPANRSAIDRILDEHKPHIFHFIGHGRFENEDEKEIGQIALVDVFGKPEWINADDFSELFNRHQPGIVLLQSCETGTLSCSEAFAGIASRVVQQNIPVVVAMQYEVSNITATRFSLEFYRRISKGDPVDKAVQEGRRQIELNSSRKNRDFATPVIFMRVQDGNLFQWGGDSELEKPDISIQKIPEKLSLHALEIMEIFSPLAQRIQAIKPDSTDKNDVAILKAARDFLNKDISAKELIQKWKSHSIKPVEAEQAPNYDVLAKRLNNGEIIPFIGSDVLRLSGLSSSFFQGMIEKLAHNAQYPDKDISLSMLCQYYEMAEHGRNTFITGAKAIWEKEIKTFHINPVFELLSSIQSPLIIISAHYDNTLENTFLDNRKKFVVVSHSFSEGEPGRIILKYSDRPKPEKPISAEELSGLNLLQHGYSVIYKICGCFSLFDKGSFENIDSLMISEKNFFHFSRHLKVMIPKYISRQFSRRFLFFGYNLKEWQDRLIASVILEQRLAQSVSYAPVEEPELFETAYWEHYKVKIFRVKLEQFMDNLTQSMNQL